MIKRKSDVATFTTPAKKRSRTVQTPAGGSTVKKSAKSSKSKIQTPKKFTKDLASETPMRRSARATKVRVGYAEDDDSEDMMDVDDEEEASEADSSEEEEKGEEEADEAIHIAKTDRQEPEEEEDEEEVEAKGDDAPDI